MRNAGHLVRSSHLSRHDDKLSRLSGGRSGVFHVADTPLGPILVHIDAELGTDDLETVEPIIADVLSWIGSPS